MDKGEEILNFPKSLKFWECHRCTHPNDRSGKVLPPLPIVKFQSQNPPHVYTLLLDQCGKIMVISQSGISDSVIPKSTFMLYHILLYLFPLCHFPFSGYIRFCYIYFCYNIFQFHVITFSVISDSVISSSVISNSNLVISNLLYLIPLYQNLLYQIHCGHFSTVGLLDHIFVLSDWYRTLIAVHPLMLLLIDFDFRAFVKAGARSKI